MSESLSKLVSYVTLVDQDERLSKLTGYAVLQTNILSLSKTVSYAVIHSITASSLADTVVSSDTFSTTFDVPESLSDTASSIGDFSTSSQLTVTLGDSVASTDDLTNSLAASATLGDTIVASEFLAGASQFASSVVDSATASDLFTLNFFATLADTVATSDALSGAGGFSETLEDFAHIVDAFEYPRIIVDDLQRRVFYYQTAPIAVSDLPRSVLYTGSPDLIVDGLVRKVLVQLQIPTTPLPPIPPEVIPDYPGIPIFPYLPWGFPVKVRVLYDTTIGTTKSLREMRVPQQQYPLWDIELVFQELRDQTQNLFPYPQLLGFHQYEYMVQLWLAMYGQTGVFGFDAPWDNSRANQYIGTGDGASYGFSVFRTWGRDAQATLLPVGLINTIYAVYIDGIEIDPAYYSHDRNNLYFTAPSGAAMPPASGAVITMTFSYYYLCRFVEDEQDFEEFAKNRWTIPSLKFRAVIWL